MTGRALLTHSFGPATLRAGLTSADVRYEETLPPAAPADYRQKLRSIGNRGRSRRSAERTLAAAGFVMDRTTTPETGGREAAGAVREQRLAGRHLARPERQLAAPRQRQRTLALSRAARAVLGGIEPLHAESRPETRDVAWHRGRRDGGAESRFDPSGQLRR